MKTGKTDKSSTRKKDTKKGKKKGGTLHIWREGRWLNLEYFKKYAWIFAAFIIAFIGLIGLRYKTKTKMNQIKALETELQLAESRKLKEKSQYMSLIRESEMIKLIRDNHLDLSFREQPPYNISITKQKTTYPEAQ